MIEMRVYTIQYTTIDIACTGYTSLRKRVALL